MNNSSTVNHLSLLLNGIQVLGWLFITDCKWQMLASNILSYRVTMFNVLRYLQLLILQSETVK